MLTVDREPIRLGIVSGLVNQETILRKAARSKRLMEEVESQWIRLGLSDVC